MLIVPTTDQWLNLSRSVDSWSHEEKEDTSSRLLCVARTLPPVLEA